MFNLSTIKAVVVGSKTKEGKRVNGNYFPKHIVSITDDEETPDRTIAARWETTVCIKGVEGNRPSFINMVVWDNKLSSGRKGLGTMLARNAEIGDSITIAANIQSFNKRVFVNGEAVIDKNGSPVTMLAHNLVVHKASLFPKELKHTKTLFSADGTFGNARCL